ncbi:hypothetical protein [Colwellia sp. 20A7]|uniref:hypothetical protein n=1 Tax=Colwellia sp. 20A7 TaxID=2689569 RepID=UPI00135A3B0B|nr:hypothetical protein [Colwellia sp. 20A7]
MDQKQRLELINIMHELYQTPTTIEEQWHRVTPLLTEFNATIGQGLEGMASMINKHFTNAEKFKDSKVQKFELESGLIKLNMYFKKLDTFEKS